MKSTKSTLKVEEKASDMENGKGRKRADQHEAWNLGNGSAHQETPESPEPREAKEEPLLTRRRRPEDQRWTRFPGESRAQPKAESAAEQTLHRNP